VDTDTEQLVDEANPQFFDDTILRSGSLLG